MGRNRFRRAGGISNSEPAQRSRRGQARAISIALVVAAVMLIASAGAVRTFEARLLCAALRVFGIDTRRSGTHVLFVAGYRMTGVALTAGCSLGPLVALFAGAGAIALWLRAIPSRRVVLAVLLVASVFFLANQLRLVVVVSAIRRWGIPRGYELSHVLLGSFITIIGFCVGVIVFVRILARQPRRQP